jgi:hypothetical protein
MSGGDSNSKQAIQIVLLSALQDLFCRKELQRRGRMERRHLLKEDSAGGLRRGIDLAEHTKQELDTPSLGRPLGSSDIPHQRIVKIHEVDILHERRTLLQQQFQEPIACMHHTRHRPCDSSSW